MLTMRIDQETNVQDHDNMSSIVLRSYRPEFQGLSSPHSLILATNSFSSAPLPGSWEQVGPEAGDDEIKGKESLTLSRGR